MMKFKLQSECPHTNTIVQVEFEAVELVYILDHIRSFLLGSGFCINVDEEVTISSIE